jgi:hypothetical protein
MAAFDKLPHAVRDALHMNSRSSATKSLATSNSGVDSRVACSLALQLACTAASLASVRASAK